MASVFAIRLFEQARSGLRSANHEFSRPKKDVVTFCVCATAKIAIMDFMNAFLLASNLEPDTRDSLLVLKKKCALLDGRFSELDISGMSCAPDEAAASKQYCLGVETVRDCLALCEAVENLVAEKFKQTRSVWIN